jgi:membrane-associated protease RseP (regulator of RpoE activity)
VQDVLEKKGFPNKWAQQALATIQGGEVYININGDRTSFFKTYQRLSHGDPMSPFLFNLVAEVLATMMRKASSQSKVKGVLTHLIPKGITHIQYNDDMILMIQGMTTR